MDSNTDVGHDPIVNRLPLEVASCIFVHGRCIQTVDLPGKTFEEKDLLQSVFLPCHVSRRWRRIALSTPDLWAILGITIKETNCTSSVEMVDQWLNRSGDLPLYLFIELPEVMKSGSLRQAAIQIMSTIVHHSTRWVLWKFLTPESFVPDLQNLISRKPLDLLDYLIAGVWPVRVRNPGLTLHLNATPRQLHCLFPISSINHSRLTHFHTPSITLNEIIQIFNTAPCLAMCTVQQVNDETPTSDSLRLVTCHSLRSLKVGRCPASLWTYCTFPILEVLDIGAYHDDNVTRFPNLRDCLRRSRCDVRTLRLSPRNADYMEMVQMLELTSNLEHLCIEVYDIDLFFFRILAPLFTEGAPFLAKLKSIGCTTPIANTRWNSVVEFGQVITSRPGHSLRSFQFTYMFRVKDFMLGRLVSKDQLQLLLDAFHDVKFDLQDTIGDDLLERLRVIYSL